MIVPPSFLFQYQLSVPRIDELPGKKGQSFKLPDHAKLFVPAILNERAAGNEGAVGLELKMAWNPNGLAIELTVHGKKLEPAGRRHDLKHSDHGLVLIDTRHTANVHRATEFCTALQFLPADETANDKPSVQLVDFSQHRNPAQQRSSRRELNAQRVAISARSISDGYRLELWIPAAQMPGFSEAPEIGHMGFYVVVEDSELGQLPLSIGDDFPIAHDPSTWLQLHLD